MTIEPTCPPAIPPRTTACPQERSAMKKCLSSYIVIRLPVARDVRVPQAQADVKLPKVFGSHMVLQCQRPLPIWGWADPGEEVTVRLDEATATAKADAKGNWKVVLPAMKADGKSHTHDRQRQEQDRVGRHPHRRGVDRLRPVQHGVQPVGEHRRQGGDCRRQLPADPPAPRRKGADPQPAKDIVVFNGQGEATAPPHRPGLEGLHAADRAPASPPCCTTSASGCTRNSMCRWA